MKSKLAWLENILLVLPFILIAISWHALPERLPIHWDVDNRVDAWAARGPALFLTAFLAVGVAAVMHLLPRLDPRLRRTGDHGRMDSILPIVRVSIIALLDAVVVVQIATSLGWQIDGGRIISGAVLILFLILGNYLPNIRPNYFIGIRTPWTLENPETWRATHHLGGRLMLPWSARTAYHAICFCRSDFCLAPDCGHSGADGLGICLLVASFPNPCRELLKPSSPAASVKISAAASSTGSSARDATCRGAARWIRMQSWSRN